MVMLYLFKCFPLHYKNTYDSPYVIMLQRLDVDLGAGDSVTVYNGDKPTYSVLAMYTGDGSDGPRYVMTTGAAAYVNMDTKSAEAGRGFQFSYKIGKSL